MATVQLRNATEGRAYYDRKKAAGKTSMEAIRCVKRRLSDNVYRPLLADAIRPSGTGPGGHAGTTLDSSAADSNPDVDASEKSLPGPATTTLPPPQTRDQTVLRPVPDALQQRRPAAVVKRTLLDHGEDRRTINQAGTTSRLTEGSQMIAFRRARSGPRGRPTSPVRRPRGWCRRGDRAAAEWGS